MSSTNMDETNQGKGGYGNHGLTFGQTKTKYEKLLSNEISSTVHNQCITKLWNDELSTILSNEKRLAVK